MSETAQPVTPPPDAKPDEKTPAPPPEKAPPKPEDEKRAQLNALLRESGVKLKLKHREIPIESLEDLTSRAQRVVGVEAALEEAKKTKSEADEVLARYAKLRESPEAFDGLDAETQVALAKWYEAKSAQYAKEKELPPEVLEARRQTAEAQAKVRRYEEAEEKRKAEAEEAEYRKVAASEESRTAAVAVEALKALGVGEAAQPRAVARVAHYLRVAVEEGLEPTPAEVAALVKDDMRAEVSAVLSATTEDSALYELLGKEGAERIMREALRRSGRGRVGTPINGEAKPKPAEDDGLPKRGTPAYLRGR